MRSHLKLFLSAGLICIVVSFHDYAEAQIVIGSSNKSTPPKSYPNLNNSIPQMRESLPPKSTALTYEKVSAQLPFKIERTELSLPSKLKQVGGGSDGGSYKFRYTSIPHYLRNKRTLLETLLNTRPEQLFAFGKKYGIALDAHRLIGIIETMVAYPARNFGQMNPEGVEEPLNMVYDTDEQKIYALEPLFDYFNKKILTKEEDTEMIVMFLHEASHLFDIGTGIGAYPNDEDSETFAKEFHRQIVMNYTGECGLWGSIDEKFRMCGDVTVGEWRLISYSRASGPLFLNKKSNQFIANPRVEWNTEVQNLPDVCQQASLQFNMDLQLPAATTLASLLQIESGLGKEIGFEKVYDHLQTHPMPADMRRAWHYETPAQECFPTRDATRSICKNLSQITNLENRFRGESIICVGIKKNE